VISRIYQFVHLDSFLMADEWQKDNRDYSSLYRLETGRSVHASANRKFIKVRVFILVIDPLSCLSVLHEIILN
jgi:hypothetical protein